LFEMGIEPYLMTSGLRGILNQRLVRRVCASCRGTTCARCAGTGYYGRMLLAELVTLDAALRRAILARADTNELEAILRDSGRHTLGAAAAAAVAQGETTREEIERVLGTEFKS